MKKVSIFSIVILLGYSALAQDTLSNKGKMKMDSMQVNKDTTLPLHSKDKLDTANTGASGNTMNSTTNTLDSAGKSTGNVTSQTQTTTTTVATDTTSKAVVTDRVIMKDDKVFMVKNNESVLLEKSYKLESGAVVSTTGIVKYPSGKIAQLKNGQFIELKKPVSTEVKKTVESKKSSVSLKKKTKS